jgi:uncharacterized protein (TIGR02186 family)
MGLAVLEGRLSESMTRAARLLALFCGAFLLSAGSASAGLHASVHDEQPLLRLAQSNDAASYPTSAKDERAAEGVEVDVSARSVAVTSTFSGTEIVAFGAVERSRQTSPEAGYYDVVIIFSGADGKAVVRSKSRVAGVWVNSDSMTFNGVPSFYGIISSRVLSEITDEKTLHKLAIGFDDLKIRPVLRNPAAVSEKEIADYKAAVIRLKKDDGLYVSSDYGVAFVGRSLFRATMRLPANIPIGTLTATTYLFHNGALLKSHVTHVKLERQGSERFIYSFARNQGFYYGITSVIIAVVAGIVASALFPRRDS